MVPILFLQKKQGAAKLKTKKKKGHDLSKVNDHPAFHFSVPTVEAAFTIITALEFLHFV